MLEVFLMGSIGSMESLKTPISNPDDDDDEMCGLPLNGDWSDAVIWL
jgi:hypothetical protein